MPESFETFAARSVNVSVRPAFAVNVSSFAPSTMMEASHASVAGRPAGTHNAHVRAHEVDSGEVRVLNDVCVVALHELEEPSCFVLAQHEGPVAASRRDSHGLHAPLAEPEATREGVKLHQGCLRSSTWSKNERRVASFTMTPKPPRPDVSG